MKNFIFSILIFSFLSAQSCLFAEEGLRIDACIWTLFQYRKKTDTITNTFSLRNAFLGFRQEINKNLYARIYLDVGDIFGKPGYDLYAGLKIKRWEIRVGQFKQFLGMEMLLPPPKLDFIEYSLIGQRRAPKNPRDVGLLFIVKDKKGEFAFACVNGTGKNCLSDDNRWKDLSGRLALQQESFLLGGNFYYGKTGPNDSLKPYERLGLELGIRSPLELSSEFLFMKDDSLKGEGFYLSLVYRQRRYQPLFRYERLEYGGGEKHLYTFGVNFTPLKDDLKLALNFVYEEKGVFRFLSQLQVAF